MLTGVMTSLLLLAAVAWSVGIALQEYLDRRLRLATEARRGAPRDEHHRG